MLLLVAAASFSQLLQTHFQQTKRRALLSHPLKRKNVKACLLFWVHLFSAFFFDT